MIIYKHEIGFRNEIKTKQVEAEEKPKTYIITNERGWKNRISKEDIGKLLSNYDTHMYTFTPDNTPFVTALIERTERKINSLKNSLEEAVAKKTELLKLLESQ